MSGTTVVGADPPDLTDGFPYELPETRWQRFLHSWWLGGILVVGCGLGLIAIFGAHPFASPSVSARVSSKVGKPSSCTEVGATQSDGKQLAVYRCTVGLEASRVAQCFTVTAGEVRQLSGTRELGC